MLPLAYDYGVAVKRDIAVEPQRDLAARRAAVAENRARGLIENLREALTLVRTGERLHAESVADDLRLCCTVNGCGAARH